MATGVNTLNGLSLTAIAEETLPVLQAKTAQFSLVSTDFSSDVAQLGSAVATRIPSAITASAYSRQNGYLPVNADTSLVTVTLNKHYHVTLGFDDSEIGNIGLPKLIQTFIQPAVYGVINQVQSDLYALITPAAFPAVYSASYASFGFAGLVAAAKVLDNSGSNTPRGAFLGTNLYYDILDDMKANPVATSLPLRAGDVGMLANIAVTMAPNSVFSGFTAGGPYQTQGSGSAGFLAGKDALCLAARIPALPNAPGVQVANVTDPNSGFTLQLRQWYSADRGMWQLSAVAIYGVSRGNTSSGVRIITTD